VEVVDGTNGADAVRQAGYLVTGSGGGGAGGQYVFASLDELDGIIAEWEALRSRIKDRSAKLRRAIGLIEPPAEDMMSRLQAGAAIQSLWKAEEHRLAMEKYASTMLEKLRAAKAEYVATDADNAAQVHRAGER
jgi:hypothetical protein